MGGSLRARRAEDCRLPQWKVVASKPVRTAGKPAAIELFADRSSLKADGKDLSFVTVRIVDSEANLCPLADNEVLFRVKGKGKLVAVGNGYQRSTASYQAHRRKAFSGICLAIVGTMEAAGDVELIAESSGLKSAPLPLRSR